MLRDQALGHVAARQHREDTLVVVANFYGQPALHEHREAGPARAAGGQGLPEAAAADAQALSQERHSTRGYVLNTCSDVHCAKGEASHHLLAPGIHEAPETPGQGLPAGRLQRRQQRLLWHRQHAAGAGGAQGRHAGAEEAKRPDIPKGSALQEAADFRSRLRLDLRGALEQDKHGRQRLPHGGDCRARGVGPLRERSGQGLQEALGTADQESVAS
mmetsp:Transcript_76202/g.246776  ORF Transcript_76202/g.246776 Transcript_76202/m.246776 type:complete len:216 (-) Transcript_76202:847-1494(-)